MIYTIPIYRKDKLLKRLEKFNKKAIKFHALPIIYSVTEPYDKEFERNIFNNETKKKEIQKYYITMVDIYMDVESFKPIKGYKFIASIEHTENGNLITKAPDVKEIPHQYRNSGHYCEHCKTDRFRKSTYIVYNEKKKKFIQVGSTCIKDYLGIDVGLIAGRFEFLHELTNASKGDFESSWIEPVYPVDIFLATALNVITFDGYVSGKKAYESDGYFYATGHKTMKVLNGPFGKINETERQWFRERLKYKDEHLEEARTIIEYIKTLPTNEDYYYNLNLIIKNNYVKIKTSNLTASMIILYRVAMEKMVKTKEYAKSEYIGTVGEKITVEATALKTFWCEGTFGTMYINNFITDKGERIVCYNSKELSDEGKRYRITATVKKHQLYKETKQTVILRPKLQEI